MNALLTLYKGLGKRGKIIFWAATIVVAIAVIELFSGCSLWKLTKTWSF
jgi:type IV secretory pathway component VirB8